MNAPGLVVERDGHVAVVTLSNPPANTWTGEILDELYGLITGFNEDRDLYAIVVTGEGERFFSAGADLKQFDPSSVEVARTVSASFGRAFEALADFRGVSIAAINGYAMGGGLECALACDIRVADEHSVLALPEATVGLLPCGGGTQNLVRVVGEGWAKRIVLLGERVDAATALRIGLVEEVTPKGEAKARASELAHKANGQSPVAVAACKRLINGARSSGPETMLPAEREAFVELFGTHDQAEGVRAFLEKRTPEWTNS